MKRIAVFLTGLFMLSASAAPLTLISHAGEQHSAPGHTLTAYKIAMDNNADIMKLDLHMTKDGVIVLMHDPTTTKMMDQERIIRRCTYQELMEQCTYKPKGGYNQEKITRLDDALKLLKDTRLQIWIDPKGFKLQGTDLVEKSLKMIEEYGISKDRLMVASWEERVLRYMKKTHPEIRRILHISVSPDEKQKGGIFVYGGPPKGFTLPSEEVLPWMKKKADELELYGYNISLWKPVTREWVQTLKDHGLWVSLWYVQSQEAAQRALDFGGDAVVSDNLKVVAPFVREKEKSGK